jgi:hypothetical protein
LVACVRGFASSSDGDGAGDEVQQARRQPPLPAFKIALHKKAQKYSFEAHFQSCANRENQASILYCLNLRPERFVAAGFCVSGAAPADTLHSSTAHPMQLALGSSRYGKT